jgi:hypothetical protein
MNDSVCNAQLSRFILARARAGDHADIQVPRVYYSRLITLTQSGIIVMDDMSAGDRAGVAGVELTLPQIRGWWAYVVIECVDRRWT